MPGVSLMGSLRTKNISQVIIDRIVASLATGELAPGDRLPTEEEFSARLGVGKSSVREAVKILEAFGVVEIRRGDGTYIVDHFQGGMLSPMILGMLMSEHSAEDLLDFMEKMTRVVLEDIVADAADVALAEMAAWPDGHDGDHIDQLAERLVDIEFAVDELEPNPLLRELARGAAELSSHHVEAALRAFAEAECLDEFLGYVEIFLHALERGDRDAALEQHARIFDLVR